jgi:peptide/nickel transport system permease protein
MKRSPGMIALTFLLLIITGIRWSLISSSILSLFSFLLMLAMSPVGAFKAFDSRLIEYWVASVAWVAMLAWLVSSLWKGDGRSRKYSSRSLFIRSIYSSPTGGFLTLCIVVAMVCPLIVPLDPNLQGNLLTTRRLPPLSTGVIVESVQDAGKEEVSGTVEGIFLGERSSILHRETSVSGETERSSESPAVEGKETRRGVLFTLGTDDVGRDVLSRMIYGVRTSLTVGILASLGAMILGLLVGLGSGMFPGFPDVLLMRLTDLFLSFPVLLLVIGVVAFVGQSELKLVAVLVLTGWMGIARMVRAETLVLREKEFILAARMFRLPLRQIAVRHLLPHIIPVVITVTVLQFANVVLAEAALGFLGLGLQPPASSLGNMMGESTAFLPGAWWVGVFPGVLLAGLLIAAHRMYEQLSGLARQGWKRQQGDDDQ